MRAKILMLLVLCGLPAMAFADSITQLSPTSFTQGSPEEYLTIDGTGLTGTDTTQIKYDGPAGTIIDVAPVGQSSTELVSFVPVDVLNNPGTYNVTVLATDTGFPTRVIGPASFTVVPLPQQPPVLFTPESVTAEATSSSGAVVTFTVSGFSFVDAFATVMCDHASGAQYPLGPTTVSCSASDSFATTFGTFRIIVSDTTPPVLSLPADFSTTSQVVTYSATATDSVNGPVNVTCSPASGNTFPFGTTTVDCTAQDLSANVAQGSFHVSVFVTLPPPTLTVPNDFTVEATGPSGAMVTYVASADQGATVVCSTPSGATFPVGLTLVQCTATNMANESSFGSFHVTVADTTPPVLSLPADFTVQSPNPIVVNFTATATDLVQVIVPVTCIPASGSVFPTGTTTVNCSASDGLNTANGSFHVTVNTIPPPTLTLPNDFTVEATSASGAVVTYVATANQNATVTCSPASGATFPLGVTTVQCSATNNVNETTNGSFKVTVVDTTAPALTLPADFFAQATDSTGAPVTYTASANDLVDGPVPIQCSPASGTEFLFGTTTVNCSATDAHGNTANGSFHITVQDTIPPQILSITASPDIIWPPNHKMVDVTVTVVTHDLSAVTSQIVSVTSNQSVTGNFVITGPLTLQLRADRDGSTDRDYTIHIVSTDAHGNSSTGTVDVFVSHRSRAASH
jgi:hypothetical protein